MAKIPALQKLTHMMKYDQQCWQHVIKYDQHMMKSDQHMMKSDQHMMKSDRHMMKYAQEYGRRCHQR